MDQFTGFLTTAELGRRLGGISAEAARKLLARRGLAGEAVRFGAGRRRPLLVPLSVCEPLIRERQPAPARG